MECRQTSYSFRVNTEAEYKALAYATTELIWVETLLGELCYLKSSKILGLSLAKIKLLMVLQRLFQLKS
jgi:hypothetical protein